MNYRDEADKFRAAVTDGLLLRAGVKLDKPSPGADEFRSQPLLDIASECLQRATGGRVLNLWPIQIW